MLATTGALYVWTTPQDWTVLQSFQLSLTTFSGGATCLADPGPSSAAAVELVRMAADDAQYRLFHAAPPSTPDFRPLQPFQSLPLECLDEYVSDGAPCGALDAPAPTFDFVWWVLTRPVAGAHTTSNRTWSNGSEALHRTAYLDYERSTLPIGSKSLADQPTRLKLFRSAPASTLAFSGP